jgi:predicted GTPase
MTLSHQDERARHLIKLLRRKTIFLFFDEQSSAATLNMKNLILQKIIILCEDRYVIIVINERF